MKDIIRELRNNYERGFDFLFQQIDEASDAAWQSKAGKCAYWQHIYHAFVCVDRFVLPADAKIDIGPETLEVAMFRETPKAPLSKDVVRQIGKAAKAHADAWIDGLQDEDLAKKNEGLSGRRGTDVSNGTTFASLIGHNFYHVGCNDTTLREGGHLGVY
ncbi:MAG: DinB family protein [Synergistaceae bacterium]|jgi:hypothetical protein|nr:DinB family protein [Synergistaceae bacterium]